MAIIRVVQIDPVKLDDINQKKLLRKLLLNPHQAYWQAGKKYSLKDDKTDDIINIKLLYSIVRRKRRSKKYSHYRKEVKNGKCILDSYQQFRYEVFCEEKSFCLGSGGQGYIFPSEGTIVIGDDENDIKCKSQTESGYGRIVKVENHNHHVTNSSTDKEFKLIKLLGKNLGKNDYLHIKPPVIVAHDNGKYVSYTAMRRLRGQDLFEHLHGLSLTVRLRLLLTINILKALKKVHKAGIVHRDLKPENIMVDLTDSSLSENYIIDFGLSKKKKVQDSTCVGTKGYISPEVVLNKNATLASDVFAIGRVIGSIWNADDPNSFFMNYMYLNDCENSLKNTLLATILYNYGENNIRLFCGIHGLAEYEKNTIRDALSAMNELQPLLRSTLDNVISKFEYLLACRVEKKKCMKYSSADLINFDSYPAIFQDNFIKKIFQTIPINEINDVVEDLFEQKDIRNKYNFDRFKRCLLTYELSHIYEINAWQIALQRMDLLSNSAQDAETKIVSGEISNIKNQVEKYEATSVSLSKHYIFNQLNTVYKNKNKENVISSTDKDLCFKKAYVDNLQSLAFTENEVKEQFIRSVKQLIEITRWHVSAWGGGDVANLDNVISPFRKIPHNVAVIYNLCKNAVSERSRGSARWDQCFREVNGIARKAAFHTSFFRTPETQNFYDKFNNAYESAFRAI